VLAPGKVLEGRYRIERLLGRGGMGAVYLARHLTLGSKLLAIKEMTAAAAPEVDVAAAIEQFRKEGELLASLDHPGIVRVSDCFEEGGRLYLAMEHIEGETLETVVERKGPLDPATVRRRLLELCDTLGYLHGHDPPVLVRDLKPANLMVDRDGRLRLIDFGIARLALGGRTTRAERGAGTAGFSPVEQYAGTADARCDIHAMGATAYVLLTRRLPPHALDRMAEKSALVPPREINPRIPPDLEAVVLRMMELRRHARYATVAEARDALLAVAEPPPLPPSESGGEVSLQADTETSRAARGPTEEEANVLGQVTMMPDDLAKPSPSEPRRCSNCRGTGQSRRVQTHLGGRRIVPTSCPDCLGLGVAPDERQRHALEGAGRSALPWAASLFVMTAAPLLGWADWSAPAAAGVGLAAAGLAWGLARLRHRRTRAEIEREMRTARPAEREASSKAEGAGVGKPASAGPRPKSRPLGSLTRFFGRSAELEHLRALLDDSTHRLVTVLGLGGSGKTRLVTEALQKGRETLPPTITASLAGARTQDEILRRLADALQVTLAAGADPLPRIERALYGSDTLLVLDGAEGLRGASWVADLLARLPELQLVCTSRQRLGLDGERLIELGGLDVPAPEAGPADLRASSAVALFLARAAAAAPDFSLDESTLPRAADICRKLNGHPWSIEVAASRLRTLSLEELAARLADRFAVLANGQEALGAFIDWSYRMLDADDQKFLRAASVFRGFWLEAAGRAIGGDLAGRLASLQDNSLLTSSTVEGRRRFALVESVQAFAEERLGEEAPALYRAHGEWFRERLETAMEARHGAEERLVHQELMADLDNIRVALARSDDARLAVSAVHFLLRAGRWQEAREQAERAAGLCAGDRGLEARAALARADVLHTLDELEPALAAARAAAETDDAGLRGRADNLAGLILAGLGRRDEARTSYERALAARLAASDPRGVAVVRHNLALLAQAEERWEDALAAYGEVLPIRTELGDDRGAAETANNMGEVLKSLGRSEEAREAFLRARNGYERAGDELGVGITRYNLGELYLQVERREEAQAEIAGALRIFEDLRVPYAGAARSLLGRVYEEAVSVAASSPSGGTAG
jgi:serine/threonine-protein kinase